MNKRSMKEYRIWKAMKSRCYAQCYANSYYQKDGIQVCDRWRYDFEAFLHDMGSIPGDDYSIERINIYGDYCPENCKWIPMKQQQKNRRNVPLYTFNGETRCLKEWASVLGFNLACVRGRIHRGMSFEDAIKSDPFNRQVEIDGRSMTMKEWCDYFGLNKGDVYSRVHRGWSKRDALLKNQSNIRRSQYEKTN